MSEQRPISLVSDAARFQQNVFHTQPLHPNLGKWAPCPAYTGRLQRRLDSAGGCNSWVQYKAVWNVAGTRFHIPRSPVPVKEYTLNLKAASLCIYIYIRICSVYIYIHTHKHVYMIVQMLYTSIDIDM